MTLREMRKAAGLSQTALAREMGCSLNTIQRYESGVSVAPEYLSKAVEVARSLGITGYAPPCPCCGRAL